MEEKSQPKSSKSKRHLGNNGAQPGDYRTMTDSERDSDGEVTSIDFAGLYFGFSLQQISKDL